MPLRARGLARQTGPSDSPTNGHPLGLGFTSALGIAPGRGGLFAIDFSVGGSSSLPITGRRAYSLATGTDLLIGGVKRDASP